MALTLRDIKTRVGGSYVGFFVALTLPLGHISIVLGIYLIMGRRAALGTDVISYLSTAILPFIVWSYTHQKLILSFPQNIPLTAFPIVRLMDIIVARSFVELLNSALIVLVFSVLMILFEIDISAASFRYLFLALFISYLLGVSTGLFFGILGTFFQISNMIGYLLIPMYWISSGVFFIPDALPGSVRRVVSFFPISHVVDFARMSFYNSYTSDFTDFGYVALVITANFVIGFILIRLGRTR